MSACFVCKGPLGVSNVTGACARCVMTARECCIAGCSGRVAAYSVMQMCRVHRTDRGLRRVYEMLGADGLRALPAEVS